MLTISPGAKLRTATLVKKADGLTYSCIRKRGLIALGVRAFWGSWWGRAGAARDLVARVRRRLVWAGVVLVAIDGTDRKKKKENVLGV